MLINLVGINNITNYYKSSQNKINFCGIKRNETDSFERSGQLIKMKMFNPFTMKFMNSEQRITAQPEYTGVFSSWTPPQSVVVP